MDYKLIGINFIISIIVAAVTVKLSIFEFYKQQIWLRKETRYNQIIHDISILQKHYGDILDKAMGVQKEGNEDSFLEKEYLSSKRQLELVTLSQGFILDKKVSETLNQLFISAGNKSSDERMGNYFSYFDRMCFETDEARKEIIRFL